jgi:Glycosyl hydrolase family 71
MAFKVKALIAFGQMACFVLVLNGCGSSSSASDAASPSASATATTSTPTTATTTTGTTTGASPTTTAPTTPATTTTSTTAPKPVPKPSTATQDQDPPAAPAPRVATTSGPLTATNSGDACLPITMPSADAMFKASKKIFAHYFYPFPISIDNRQPAEDYYNAQYLNKNGESNKWLAEGGYLRQRPLGVNPSTNPQWRQLNMQREVAAAIARGITGFTFDVMSLEEVTDATSQLHTMLKAAQAVDSRFKVIVMPDITVFKSNADAVVEIIESVASSPAAYRLADGRLVVSAFDAGLNSPIWWESVISKLKARGIAIAFVPTFLGWNLYAELFAPISYGFADWGTATDAGSSYFEGTSPFVHSTYDRIFMNPIDPQQYRPKSFVYWEAGNSAAFRAGWTSSIQGDADWVQLVTWNDFSESGEVEPYTDATLKRDIGTGYYDLNGYYASRYLTGHEPIITHDVLYYFYRREPPGAAAKTESQTDHVYTGVAENDIELLAFLTAPGELKITVDGKTYTKNAPAGMVSFKVPALPGTPLFTLARNGTDVFSFKGGVQIYGNSGLPSGVADMTYWSGSAAKSGICSL